MGDKPIIEPLIKRGGSAFVGNSLNATHPIPCIKNRQVTKVVTLSQWCRQNFITKRIARKLIAQKMLIGFRRHGEWWIAANPDCLKELLEYLGVEELIFDADNG